MDADSALMATQLVVVLAFGAIIIGFILLLFGMPTEYFVLIVIMAIAMVLLVAIAFGGAAQRADAGTFLALAPPFRGALDS